MGTVRYDYSGKVVLVTGSGSGIGRAIAEAFAAAGATIAIADISAEAAAGTVAAIRAGGGSAEAFHVDVADEEAAARLTADVAARLGSLDCAINNAGIEAPTVPMAELAGEHWRRVCGVNLSGVFYAMKAQIPVMLAQGGGAIVNTASISALIGGYNLAAYTATKHGVLGMTRAAAMDYAEGTGLRINALCPGLVDTPFIAAIPEGLRKRLIDGIPMRRPGKPEEMARAVLWLCSDDATYVTGHAMVVDGGASLGGESTRFDEPR